MAITVDTQNNPSVSIAGTPEADATIIYSGHTTGTILYELEQLNNEINGEPVFSGSLSANSAWTLPVEGLPQLLTVSPESIKMILPFRTTFRVRVKKNSEAWSTWTEFKTREKSYARPGSINELSEEISYTAAGASVTVTNTAKSTVELTAQGATVTNTDLGYTGTTSISYTAAGATVYNDKYFLDENGNQVA
jgi:hypothetical protein